MPSTKQSIKIVTLNIGRGFPGLEKSIGFLGTCGADVLCIQDIRQDHVDRLPDIFGPSRHFVAMTNHLIEGRRVPVGIGIFSKHPFVSTSAHAFWGSVSPVKDLEGVTIGAGGNANAHDLDVVRSTESRLVIFADVKVGDSTFRIGTLHGVWVPGGKVDDHQRRCMDNLRLIMDNQFGIPLVLAGDFNAARGGEIYQMLVRKDHAYYDLFDDVVPDTIVNTVDWQNRGKPGGPDLVVDYILKNDGLTVRDVEVHFGVSDHAALTATVSSVV